MGTLKAPLAWLVAIILFAAPLLAQNPQQLSVLTGTQLGSGLDLGINTSGGLTNWLSVEPPPPSPGDLKMVCPAAQQWCAMFISQGTAISTYPRPGLDLSVYQTMLVEIEGDPGTTIQIGVKDATQPDDGTETKVTLPVTSTWTSYAIPLSSFATPVAAHGGYVINFHKIYIPCEFVFAGGPAQTVKVRTITYSTSTPPPLSSGAPLIFPGGVVPVYSSATTIQPGSWSSIYGDNLAGVTMSWNGDFPTSLGGTSVTIDGKPAYLLFVSAGQIDFQAPDDTATGTVPVVVTTQAGNGGSTVTLEPFGPSFLVLGDGKHVTAVVLTPGSPGNSGAGYDVIGPSRPVKAGETMEVYGVGFGPTKSVVPAGKLLTSSTPTTNIVQVTIGGVPVPQANVQFSGLVEAGLYQLNVLVPSNLGTGDQAILAMVGGLQTQSNVLLSLQ